MSNALSSLFELQALDTQLLEKRRTVQRYQDELARRKAAGTFRGKFSALAHFFGCGLGMQRSRGGGRGAQRAAERC